MVTPAQVGATEALDIPGQKMILSVEFDAVGVIFRVNAGYP
jgi:hypothetical protein